MNDAVERLLRAPVDSWYRANADRAHRWSNRVPPTWLTETKLQRAIEASSPGQVSWLQNGLEQPSPSVAPHELHRVATDARASLRVQRIQTLDEQLRDLALAFVTAFGEEVNINAYASGPGAAGLAVHTDPYDVFVLHTAGTKRWHLEGHLGAEGLPFDETHGGHLGELLLQPGDVLFLPAALRHRAEVVDGPALHLTLSLQVKTRRSLIEWLATELDQSADGEAFRPRHAQGPRAYAEAFSWLRDAVADRLTAEPTSRWLTYREGVEYERTLAPFTNYRAMKSRGYR